MPEVELLIDGTMGYGRADADLSAKGRPGGDTWGGTLSAQKGKTLNAWSDTTRDRSKRAQIRLLGNSETREVLIVMRYPSFGPCTRVDVQGRGTVPF